MSQIESNPAKAANAQVNPTPALGWDVFVTPGIPIVTIDLPPGITQAYFQAMASTLIYGARDAVLVDAFMTVKQANALANWIAAKGKNLTTIYITHAHGDHWFGVGTLLERFPNASPDVVKVMRQNTSPEFLDKVWKAAFPGQIPDNDDNPRIIEETRQYIRDLDRLAEATRTAQELYDKMLELYPNRVNPWWALWSSVRAVKSGNNQHSS